jgi:hypothetical protein
MSRHDSLRARAGGKIGPQRYVLDAARRRRNFELKRRAGIPVPDFGGVDAVPMRTLAVREQKINRRRCGAAVLLPAVPRMRGG